LKEDLVDATNMIEEADAASKLLEKRLAEKDVQLAEEKCIVFVEHSRTSKITTSEPNDSTTSSSSYPPPPSTHDNLATTLELPPLPVEKS